MTFDQERKDAPVTVLGIDPGAAGAGYAVWDNWKKCHIYIGTEPPTMTVDAVVCETGGWAGGRMGVRSVWGLGFDAGWRLCECSQMTRALYVISPEAWRQALPVRPGLHAKFDGLPGDVIVARLRMRYGLVFEREPGASVTEHEVEACGIAEAAAAILARPKAKDRKALKAVKR